MRKVETAVIVAALVLFGLPALSFGQWTQLAPIPDPGAPGSGLTEGAAVSGVGDIIVVAAGYSPVTSDNNITRLYDISTDTWSFGALALHDAAESAYGDTSHGGKTYVIGGRTPGSGNLVQQYDVATDSWALMADMPTPRAAAAVAVIGDGIYVMGGRWSDEGEDYGGAPCSYPATDVVERYDVPSNTWSTVAPLPSPRSDFAAVAVGNNGGKIYVFGGCNQEEGRLDDVDVYDPVTDTWSTAPTNMLLERNSLMAGRKGNKIYVMGGQDDGGLTDRNEEYNIVKDTWTQVADMPSGIASPAGCPVGAGGKGETGVYSHAGMLFVPGGACPLAGTSTNGNLSFKP